MYRVRFEPAAVDELLEAYRWLEGQSPVAAYRWFDGLLSVIDTLERQPYRCPVALENESFPYELRSLLYGRGRTRYRTLFRVTGEVVNTVSVRHGSRAPLPPPAAD